MHSIVALVIGFIIGCVCGMGLTCIIIGGSRNEIENNRKEN